MRIAVGSTNQVKVRAVFELLPQYQMLAGAELFSGVAPSMVSPQPKSLEEIIRGAKNRAEYAFKHVKGCTLGFGIESGLFEVPYTKTGMMDVCACAIFGGSEYSIGLSSAFECPPKVIDLVHSEGLDLNMAFHKAGLTSDLKIGNAGGAIGLLTKSRVDRMAYTKQAITMAMIHLENEELYSG